MSLAIRAPKDFGLGAIYVAAGAAGVVIAQDYPFGSGARMGPGYFPTIVGSLLFLFGLAAVARSLTFEGGKIGLIGWKALGLVIGALVVFMFLVDRAGFPVAGMALLLLCAAASRRFRPDAVALLGAAGLIAACSLVFVRWLGVPMPLVGSWLKAALPVATGG